MIQFERASVAVGDYLHGHYAWPAAVRLGDVELRCTAPSAVAQVEFEIAGVMSGVRLFIPPSSIGTVLLRVPLGNFVVAANAEVRCKVISGSGTLPSNLSLSVSWAWASVIPVQASSAPKLWLRWFNFPEVLDVLDYSSVTEQFTERVTGVTTGRCAVGNSSNFSLSILGSPALTMVSNVLTAAEFLEIERQVLPRVEFWKESPDGVRQRLGWVGTGGKVFAPLLSEGAVTSTAEGFVLRGGGIAKAFWSSAGLVAAGLAES